MIIHGATHPLLLRWLSHFLFHGVIQILGLQLAERVARRFEVICQLLGKGLVEGGVFHVDENDRAYSPQASINAFLNIATDKMVVFIILSASEKSLSPVTSQSASALNAQAMNFASLRPRGNSISDDAGR